MSKKPCTNRNYDNRELTADEELVLYFWDENTSELITNPDSIHHFRVGGKIFIGVWTAFKIGIEANLAKAQFYSYLRDANGQFHCKDALSLDNYRDTYQTEPVSKNPDPADVIIAIDNATKMIQRLKQEAPQLLAAAIFHRNGISGSDFRKAMRIGHSRAAAVQNILSDVLHDMLYLGYDKVELPARKTKHDDYYLEIINNSEEEIIKDIRKMVLMHIA